MSDLVSSERSAIMRKVGRQHTRPEIVVRRLIHSFGVRYRLHGRDLPGSPDVVLRKRRIAIFVHGCFWHHHEGCRKASVPKTRTDYWLGKFSRNRERDAKTVAMLEEMGWSTLTVWECETRDLTSLGDKLRRFLGLQ